MELLVPADSRVVVAPLGRGLRVADRPLDRVERCRGELAGALPSCRGGGGHRFQRLPDLVRLDEGREIEFGDDDSSLRVDREPFDHEPLEDRSHRRSAHVQTLGQGDLGDPLARHVVPVHDELANNVVDLGHLASVYIVFVKYHQYEIETRWTGNTGSGTAGYRTYRRDNETQAAGKPVIPGSSDPAFRGDATRYSPEDLLVASVSACHMLWYLHLCADAGIVVTAYTDRAAGTMSENQDGSGEFTNVTLRPTVVVHDESNLDLARRLHADVHRYCFIARSVNFPISIEPSITCQPAA